MFTSGGQSSGGRPGGLGTEVAGGVPRQSPVGCLGDEEALAEAEGLPSCCCVYAYCKHLVQTLHLMQT